MPAEDYVNGGLRCFHSPTNAQTLLTADIENHITCKKQRNTMKKFVYIYLVSQTIPDNEANVQLWGQWFEKLGKSVADVGSSFESSDQAQVTAGVVTREPDDIAGYTIVEADSLDQAVQWLVEGPLAAMENLQVRVYEAK